MYISFNLNQWDCLFATLHRLLTHSVKAFVNLKLGVEWSNYDFKNKFDLSVDSIKVICR